MEGRASSSARAVQVRLDYCSKTCIPLLDFRNSLHSNFFLPKTTNCCLFVQKKLRKIVKDVMKMSEMDGVVDGSIDP
jgi:hypothetical protein